MKVKTHLQKNLPSDDNKFMPRRFWIIRSSFVWALKIQLKTTPPLKESKQTELSRKMNMKRIRSLALRCGARSRTLGS